MPPTNFRNSRFLKRSPQFSMTTRRRFLQASAAATTGVILANCQRNLSDVGSSDGGNTASPTSGSTDTLHVYTWADYTDQELADSFTQKTGIRVVSDTYDSNETMLAKLQAGGGNIYSVIYPSDYMVQKMIGMGMLTELDKSQIEGVDNLRDKWSNPGYDPGNAHSIPTTWGTTGLIYNSTVLNPNPEDWAYLWDEQRQISRKMTLLDDVREVMGASLRSLGYSYNSVDPAEIEAAHQRLVELKPAIASFKSFGWEDQLMTGDTVLSMVYSVDAISATLENPDLNYIIPASGSSVWTDTMAIPTTAPNPEAAYAWINFLLEPENAARAVERLKFATPNQPAFELLSNELKENTDLFPPDDVLKNCEGIAPISQEISELYDRYWTELRSA
ncbi:ABC transporter substrate-binding protein [Oculatella sp. LEGE 06141]